MNFSISTRKGTTCAPPPRCGRAHAMTPFTPRCHHCQLILRLPEGGHRMHIGHPTKFFGHVEVLTTLWDPYYTIHKQLIEDMYNVTHDPHRGTIHGGMIRELFISFNTGEKPQRILFYGF
ncbi:hypothetical protein QYE76_008069 [Lolium multiflorum]|uniref:Uncharacterized protein n=1 Tax=Lolium multiflorum TaxID=4521 RepID=A0AAD8VD87_LOLMU|nr:hypothetical protein QYE76_008069 [Lolium multiflorum]